MNMQEAKLLIAQAYASGDPDEKAAAHRAACHATVNDAGEAAAMIVIAQAQLRALAATAVEGNIECAQNLGAVLKTLFEFLDPRPNPLH